MNTIYELLKWGSDRAHNVRSINSLIINLTGAILIILVTYEMLTKKQKKRTAWIYYLVIYYVMCTILRV